MSPGGLPQTIDSPNNRLPPRPRRRPVPPSPAAYPTQDNRIWPHRGTSVSLVATAAAVPPRPFRSNAIALLSHAADPTQQHCLRYYGVHVAHWEFDILRQGGVDWWILVCTIA